MFSYPDTRCPQCNGRIDTKPFSLGGMFGIMIAGEIATYVVAGIFMLVGLMWEPAWIIALVIVIAIIVRKSAKQAHYVCTQCHREFTHKQLHAAKP